MIFRPVSSRAWAEDLEPALAEPAELVGRGPRLVGAAAQDRGAGGSHGAGGLQGLVAGLDRAGTGDDGDGVTADGQVAEGDRGLAGLEVPAGELELLGDADDLLDAGQDRELLVERRRQRQPDDPDDRPLLAIDQVRAQAQFLDPLDDEVD